MRAARAAEREPASCQQVLWKEDSARPDRWESRLAADSQSLARVRSSLPDRPRAWCHPECKNSASLLQTFDYKWGSVSFFDVNWSPVSIQFCKFKLEVQDKIVCRFAPEGRDVYSLVVIYLIRSSVGAQSLLPDLAKVPLPGFAPNGARSLGVRS